MTLRPQLSLVTMAAFRLGAQVSQWLMHAGGSVSVQPSRFIQKHWNPKWKKLRKAKVMKVDLPNYHEKEEEMTPEQRRSRMRKAGVQPPRPWVERPFLITSTGQVLEPYVPPEGDGRASIISTAGAKQGLTFIEKKSRSMMSIRKIKSFDEDFKPADFANHAQDIYIKAHTYMASDNNKNLIDYVTERCLPEMLHNSRFKTIHWKFLQSLEPPRVVHARHTDVITKENIFAQVTVRFHSQQQLAIYDRFGRLMYGSEILAKDVLEYVVFEKHLSNVYGTWRLHEKIIPDWMPPREPALRTFIRPEEILEEEVSKAVVEKEVEVESVAKPTDQPPLATA